MGNPRVVDYRQVGGIVMRNSMWYFLLAEASFIPQAVAILWPAFRWLIIVGDIAAMLSIAANFYAHREKE